MNALSLLYSPFPDAESTTRAAQALLEQKLAACCNLLPGTQSLYWWEGRIAQASEVILIVKTPPALAAQAADALAQLHPYGCPAILQLSAAANAAFAQHVHTTLS
ncbi:MAG: divalent-cation tolerance protein CutA [Pseudomonadota bacterium]